MYHNEYGYGITIKTTRSLPVVIYKKGNIPKEVRKYCIEAESLENMIQIIEQIKENGCDEGKRKKAMEYARGFTWEKYAEKTLKVYNKLVIK